MMVAQVSPLLELHQLGRDYGPITALADVTLRLPPGRIGLLGPNGAGKSTLLKILMGLVPPTRGNGKFLGVELNASALHRRQLRERVGFMPEVDGLVPGLSGVEYVAFAGELCGLPRRQALRRAHEILGFLELGEARYRRVEDYSTGMRQRVKLAQAVVHDPPVLLLDEPTAGLDPAGREAMLQLIRRLAIEHGKAVILSTHLLADVDRLCDWVVVLAAGRVRAAGPLAELKDRRGRRFRLGLVGQLEMFADRLQQHGVTILEQSANGDWRVLAPIDWPAHRFFLLAVQCGVVIRRLLPDEETLEEMFLRLLAPHNDRDG